VADGDEADEEVIVVGADFRAGVGNDSGSSSSSHISPIFS
jgi:hypothetical protein